ncbi:LysR family transcriptional regulator [Bailinhaonella thermotolerans]|uniref:LysR family transcriptional regulator n=1 Tax=Bailinhaonella thermotolerans TaxID=1070861 RepID=A0A3A4B3S4_9ACTN|nr:LysR family transcriptional regulator [Bailinhaonella thermotolerans]RJL32835.1 LysR family transcriptional regulator [Bailinhaonella thermotolerans]
MQLELRHLRILKTIADAGSLTRAAAALGLSQPALTAQLRRIEQLLGREVFTRGRQGVTATPYGEFVLTRTRTIMANLDEILARGPESADPPAVRVGGADNHLVVGLLEQLTEVFPGARVSLRTEYFIRVLLDLVIGGALDVALVADYPGHELRRQPTFETGVVAVEPVFVALSAAHPLAARQEIDLPELAREPWAVPPSDGLGWPEHLLEVCAAAGFTPRAQYRMAEPGSRRQLIAAGRAVTACQALFRQDAEVAVRPLRGDPLSIRHLLVWNPASPVAARADEVLAAAREGYRRLLAPWRHDHPRLAARFPDG